MGGAERKRKRGDSRQVRNEHGSELSFPCFLGTEHAGYPVQTVHTALVQYVCNWYENRTGQGVYSVLVQKLHPSRRIGSLCETCPGIGMG